MSHTSIPFADTEPAEKRKCIHTARVFSFLLLLFIVLCLMYLFFIRKWLETANILRPIYQIKTFVLRFGESLALESSLCRLSWLGMRSKNQANIRRGKIYEL